MLPKIFSPLTTTKAKSMGMGLAICKRVVEVHGGRISVKSVVGKGTTCTAALPLKMAPALGVADVAEAPLET